MTMRRLRFTPFILGALSAFFTLSFGMLWWFDWALTQPIHASAGIFTIQRGATLRDVAFALKRQGIIENPFLLLWYGEVSGKDKSIRAGVYDLSESMKLRELLNLLVRGSNVRTTILLPEGITLRHAVERFEAAGMKLDKDVLFNPPKGFMSAYRFFKDAPKSASLEGFFFPDKYFFDPAASTRRVAQTVLDNFSTKFDPNWYVEISKQGHTVYETVIMASILEKEVRSKQEKKIVAGLLWKRLAVGMPLQVDSSVNYATGKSLPSVSLQDLEVDSKYNTYKYIGLPPGPISNPGKESLEAAIFPLNSEYWYYLSRQDTGQSIFSRTYKEHISAKAKYLR